MIGNGSYSNVYSGTYKGKKCAIKKVHTRMRDLENEVNFLKILKHPRIVKLYARTHDSLYLELAPNGDLFSLIISGKLSEKVSRYYFHQLISGIEYCHTNSVVHRDIKPENLLLDKNYDLKICDFGLSIEHKKNMINHSGTYAYMSPECVSMLSYDGFANDIFSCGMVLFMMVTRSPPFKFASLGQSHFYNLQRKKEIFWKYFGQVSEEFKDLIEKMLTYEEQRINLEKIKLHPWYLGEIASSIEVEDEILRRKYQN